MSHGLERRLSCWGRSCLDEAVELAPHPGPAPLGEPSVRGRLRITLWMPSFALMSVHHLHISQRMKRTSPVLSAHE
ncbi:hypothetical protein SPILM97S_00341 [Streptomyces pilosus]